MKETWEKNEWENVNTGDPGITNESPERVIEEEASEYENANKEERLLTGDRASVKDEGAEKD